MTKKPTPAQPAAAPLVLHSGADTEALSMLADAGLGDETDDGLSEMRSSDFKTPFMLFNLKGRMSDDAQTKITQDVFWDTVDKVARPELNFVLLNTHKSNQYGLFVQAEKRTRRMCSSFDQVTGTFEDGRQRQCKGCPDTKWVKQQDGKSRSNCSEVLDWFCLELDLRKVFILRFKRTSLDPAKAYLQAYHYGKRPLPDGRRANMPTFVYRVHARLQMDPKDTHALPVLTRGAMFSAAEVAELSQTATHIGQTLAERMTEAEASAETNGNAESDGAAHGPADFAYGANAQGDDQDSRTAFVPQ